jgi:hypothetical protein
MENHETNFNEFIGWFIALIFPFAALGLMEVTKMPIISAAIYYLVCGIYIRYKLDGKLPYLKPQFSKVKLESFLFLIGALICAYLYLVGVKPVEVITGEMIINLFVFAIINGTFEHLVWVNIYDLAGQRKKYLGVIASTIYVGLIHAMFWSKFIPAPEAENNFVFILSQLLILWIPLRIYAKTKDLTIWSIQHILYNILAVVVGGFGISLYLFH